MDINIKFKLIVEKIRLLSADIFVCGNNVGEISLILNDGACLPELRLEMEYKVWSDYQNKGIAKNTVKTVLSHLKQAGFDDVSLRISTENEDSYNYSRRIAKRFDFIDMNCGDVDYRVYTKALNERKLTNEEKLSKLEEMQGLELTYNEPTVG